MTARELLQELQKVDEEFLDLPLWVRFMDSTGVAVIDKKPFIDPEPTIWNTGVMTITIEASNMLWKRNKP